MTQSLEREGEAERIVYTKVSELSRSDCDSSGRTQWRRKKRSSSGCGEMNEIGFGCHFSFYSALHLQLTWLDATMVTSSHFKLLLTLMAWHSHSTAHSASAVSQLHPTLERPFLPSFDPTLETRPLTRCLFGLSSDRLFVRRQMDTVVLLLSSSERR